MGCASSQEDVQEISYGPVAGQKKQFIEAVNVPTQGAQKKVEIPKYVKVSPNTLDAASRCSTSATPSSFCSFCFEAANQRN